jgi:hypothetical protein
MELKKISILEEERGRGGEEGVGWGERRND